MEGDVFPLLRSPPSAFQSTPSAWRATSASVSGLRSVTFQSTPSAWRATRPLRGLCSLRQISIHALRVEGDGGWEDVAPVVRHFNPRPPRGGRLTPTCAQQALSNFNPRPPRGGRHYCFSPLVSPGNFNPRPPRGGRPLANGPLCHAICHSFFANHPFIHSCCPQLHNCMQCLLPVREPKHKLNP